MGGRTLGGRAWKSSLRRGMEGRGAAERQITGAPSPLALEFQSPMCQVSLNWYAIHLLGSSDCTDRSSPSPWPVLQPTNGFSNEGWCIPPSHLLLVFIPSSEGGYNNPSPREDWHTESSGLVTHQRDFEIPKDTYMGASKLPGSTRGI